MDLITHEEMLAVLRATICRHGGQTKYAQHLGVSCTFLSRMLTGHRNVTGKVLADLGYERVIAYRRRAEAGTPLPPANDLPRRPDVAST
jgi:hypothetical protein